MSEPVLAAQTPVADKFAYLRARKIVVVDDAFDPPELADLDETDVDRFLAECLAQHGLRQQLAELLGAQEDAAPELTPEGVSRLWEHRSAGSDLALAANTTLFTDALD